MVDKIRAFLSLSSHPNLVFWISFLILNGLLFLPLYLLNWETTTLLPFSTAAANRPTEAIKQLTQWRSNLDVCRLNAEMLLFVALWVAWPWLRRSPHQGIFRWSFGTIYLVVFTYYVYESVMRSLYQVEPILYNDYYLAVDGLQTVARLLEVPWGFYVALVGVLLVGLVLMGQCVRLMLAGAANRRFNYGSKFGLLLLALWVFMSLVMHQEALASPNMVVSSFAYKLRQNVVASSEVYQEVQAFDDALAQNTYDYKGFDLLQKPNIYLIFVESYGSVLYKRPDYREAYTALLGELQAQLQAQGWYAASALSEAPTWGGASWMSYTSTLFGLRVDTQPHFLGLLDKYQTATYPDMGHYFKTQGYEYVRLSSLSVELDEEERQQFKNFYGVDRWLRYNDLEFRGTHYGWGPSPPDQYVLHFAQDVVLRGLDKPFFLFFITQNSHYPWVPLPEVADDWRTLNEMTPEVDIPLPDPIPHPVKRLNYFKAIKYELSFLTDYILKQGDEHAIFILIGDHQPQQVSRRSDNFDTPVHILSQDAALIDAFLDYGFGRGLAVQPDRATMRHEGFYSMFVRVLLSHYGRAVHMLPTYMPDGLISEDSVSSSGPS